MRDWTALAAQHPDRFVEVDGCPVPILAGGGGGGAKVPDPPQPTEQEVAIQKEQLNLLKVQVEQAQRQAEIFRGLEPGEIGAYLRDEVARARELGPVQHQLALRQLEVVEKGVKLQDQLQPFVLQSMRLVDDGAGTVRRMTEAEYVATLSPQEKLAYDNTTLALERETKALRGELPLSEASQQRKRDEFTAFKEQMARSGNPITGDAPESATASTTPGTQALKAFTERWSLVEEAERRGELTQGSQSVLARLGVASDIGARQREGLLSAVPGYSIPGRIGGTGINVGALVGGMGSSASPDFAGALQPYQAQRAGQTSANTANAQLRANEQAAKRQAQMSGLATGAATGATVGTAIFPGVGTLIGGLVGAGVGYGVGTAASSRDVKKDIRRASRREDRRALEMVKDLDGYTFRYKAESGRAPKRMGMMADEVPDELATPDRRGIDLGRLAGVLTAATRELARQKGR